MNLKNKLRTTKSFAFIVIICSVFFTLSCSHSICEIPDIQDSINGLKSNSVLQANEFRFINKKYKISEGIPIWKQQLNMVIENNSLIRQSELELIGYEYDRKINDQNELGKIKSEIINSNTFFPVYEVNSERFTIVKKEISEYDLFLDMVIPNSEYAKTSIPVKSDKSPLSDAVYFFKENDLSLINLKWKYKNEILNTICLVSEKQGIVFDNFLYFIHFASGKIESVKNISTTISRLKSANAEEDGNIQYTFHKEDEAYNWYGIRVWYYNINCTVTGTMIGSQKSITDKSLSAYHDAAYGFSCDAQINSKSFQTGTSGYLDFAWGYCCKTGTSASLSWNGIGFTINGGGTGATGEEYVSPIELN